MTDEIDDVTAAPAIVMVANGMAPAALVLPSTAELGRRIAAAGGTHEIADERMSRDHAKVRWDRGTWVIDDLDSRNGTHVNGERITGSVRRRGDVIVRLGHTLFVLVGDGRGQPVREPDAAGVVAGRELERVFEQTRQLAASSSTLLVQGEAGTGKQLVARRFHAAGPRAAGPFVMVGCGAIHGVADRILFGGKKGVIETIGHFQMARGGTLYLAGLADLDHTAQAALWRLLDVRDATDGDPEVGIVCGGHELRIAVGDGKLRDDLYQRLSRAAVTLPPLRTRRLDLVRLVQLEVATVAREKSRTLGVHPRLIEACLLRPWPGNVRELRVSVRQAALVAIAEDRDVVRPEDLADTAGVIAGANSAETAVERKPAQEIDKARLIEAMQQAGGSIATAARMLGVHKNALIKLLDEHGLAYDD